MKYNFIYLHPKYQKEALSTNMDSIEYVIYQRPEVTCNIECKDHNITPEDCVVGKARYYLKPNNLNLEYIIVKNLLELIIVNDPNYCNDIFPLNFYWYETEYYLISYIK